MKLVFAHDHTFYKYNNQFYSSGGLSKEILERYTSVFEEVVVISRQIEIKKFDNNLTLASTERVKFIKVPNFKKMGNIYKVLKSKKIIKNVISKTDALIARLPSSIGSMAVSLAKKMQKPYLTEMVACPWDALWNHSIKGKFIAPFVYLGTKKKVQQSNNVVYVTNKFLQKRYPTNGDSINCSNVALTEFSDKVLSLRLKRINDMKTKDKIIIGTTAAVNVKYKGQQYVIEALGHLKKKGHLKFEYQLVGAGDQSFLKSIAKKYNVIDEIKFLGPLPHEDVFNWLESIDLYAQPSRQEGLPRALIEAMSRGLPAFGANTAGIPELLEQEFIVSNTRSNVKEICSILLNFTKEKMKAQSRRNFEESKKYERNIIERRRNKFFKKFRSHV